MYYRKINSAFFSRRTLKKTIKACCKAHLPGSMLQARLSRCQVVALMLLKNASTCGSHPRIGDSKGGKGCRLLSSAVHIRGKGDSASRRVSHPWLVPSTHVLGVALGRAANDDVAHPEGRGNKNWQPQWQGCHQSYPCNAAKARTCRQETLSSTAHFFYRWKKWSPSFQPDAPLLALLATRKMFRLLGVFGERWLCCQFVCGSIFKTFFALLETAGIFSHVWLKYRCCFCFSVRSSYVLFHAVNDKRENVYFQID